MISCYHLTVPHPEQKQPLLDDVCIEIDKGAFVEIVGPSGAGKSLLFSVLTLGRPPAGARCIIAGRNLERLGEAGLAELRRDIGSCAQRPQLLGERTVLENLILPLVARGEHERARERVNTLIDDTRLEALAQVPAAALSDSEARLCAIFRALVGSPKLVVIDAGLAGLGELAEDAVLGLRQAHERGATVVIFGRELSPLDAIRTTTLRLCEGRVVSSGGGDEDSQVIDGAA